MCKRELETTLIDADPAFGQQQSLKFTVTERGVTIAAEGHGDYGSTSGHGSPLYLELYRGSLRLIVWSDINSEEPTHIIDLTGAREDRRTPA